MQVIARRRLNVGTVYGEQAITAKTPNHRRAKNSVAGDRKAMAESVRFDVASSHGKGLRRNGFVHTQDVLKESLEPRPAGRW